MKKLFFVFTILVNMLLGGCLSEGELSDIALAVSIGIDKSEEGYLITYQVMNPKAISSKVPNEAPIMLYEERGEDLFKIKRRITEQSPRKMYHSHLRTVVLGEKIAEEGIADILDFLVRGHEYRSDFYFLIAKGTTANDILKVITPLETVSQMEVYNSIDKSEKNWALTKTTKIYELINQIISDGDNPVLNGVEILNPNDRSDSNENLKMSDAARLTVTGLGAFRKDKLVGWLTEEESMGYNNIIGNVKSTGEYVEYEQNRISIEGIFMETKRKVYLSKGKPAINVDINWTYDVAAVTGDVDMMDEDVFEEVNDRLKKKLEMVCNKAVKRAKEDLKSDIFGFGEDIHRAYPKLWKDIKDDWNNEFTELPVNFNIEFKINNLGTGTESVFSKGD